MPDRYGVRLGLEIQVVTDLNGKSMMSCEAAEIMNAQRDQIRELRLLIARYYLSTDSEAVAKVMQIANEEKASLKAESA